MGGSFGDVRPKCKIANSNSRFVERLNMSSDKSDIDKQKLRDAIHTASRFTTIDIIRVYSGRYVADEGDAAQDSQNLRFGKFLSDHRTELGIDLIADNQPAIDDNGTPTHTAVWRLR